MDCASLDEYADMELGMTPKKARELVLLMERLEELPCLRVAMVRNVVGWTKARDVARIAAAETDAAWTERAGDVNSRELEADLRVSRRGDFPPAHVGPLDEPKRVRLSFEVDVEDVMIVRKAIALMKAQMGEDAGDIDEGMLLAEMARAALTAAQASDPAAAAEERYRIVIEECPSCNTMAHVGQPNGRRTPVSESTAERAKCDHDVMDYRPGKNQGKVTRKIPRKRRRTVLHRAKYTCEVPSCHNHTWIEA